MCPWTGVRVQSGVGLSQLRDFAGETCSARLVRKAPAFSHLSQRAWQAPGRIAGPQHFRRRCRAGNPRDEVASRRSLNRKEAV